MDRLQKARILILTMFLVILCYITLSFKYKSDFMIMNFIVFGCSILEFVFIVRFFLKLEGKSKEDFKEVLVAFFFFLLALGINAIFHLNPCPLIL